MFEEYLTDSNYFAVKATEIKEESEKKRYYRVSVFCAMSAVEAFINYIGNTFEGSKILGSPEIAFLMDKKFDIAGGTFQVVNQKEYHKIEDKLKFLLHKFVPKFDFNQNSSWSNFIELKKFRDKIIHPHHEEDDTTVADYKKKIKNGLSAAIDIMNHLCKGIFKRYLRKRILDLTL